MKYVIKYKTSNNKSYSQEINSLSELQQKIITLKNEGQNLDNVEVFELKAIDFQYTELVTVKRHDLSSKVKKGLRRAKRNGVKLGPPPTVNKKLVKKLLKSKENKTYTQIARLANCSRATVCRVAMELKST